MEAMESALSSGLASVDTTTEATEPARSLGLALADITTEATEFARSEESVRQDIMMEATESVRPVEHARRITVTVRERVQPATVQGSARQIKIVLQVMAAGARQAV
jgi:hypothetical protein